MLLLYRLLAKQFRKPNGMIGRIVSKKMEKLNVKPYAFSLSKLEIKPNEHVLEVGYGPGRGIEKLYECVEKGDGSVTGIDFSATMKKKASRLNRPGIETGKVSLKLGSAECTNLQSAGFDALLGVNVVYFFNSARECLHELKRVLKPGGRAAFYVTDKQFVTHMPDHCFTKYSGDEFAKKMVDAGFEQVEVHTTEPLNEHGKFGHCVMGKKPS